ncbi:MAG: methyltransferase [Chitinophagales bacterium]|jgi:tRNA1Val (adenine37-N6)-methyltransferase|nr:methyltransferase [Chitinophagales bacterium]
MDLFHFQDFSLYQNENVFKIGFDAVIFAALMRHRVSGDLLEIGLGSGVISMIIYHYAYSKLKSIEGCDVEEEAISLSRLNALRNKISIKLQKGDFLTLDFSKKYDFILTNPPYYLNSYIKSSKTKENFKHNSIDILQDWWIKASTLLKPQGKIAWICRLSDIKQWYHIINASHLFLVEQIEIFHLKPSGHRVLLIAQSAYTQTIFSKIDIYLDRKTYHQDYLKLVGDIYLSDSLGSAR